MSTKISNFCISNFLIGGNWKIIYHAVNWMNLTDPNFVPRRSWYTVSYLEIQLNPWMAAKVTTTQYHIQPNIG